jgi:ATP-dependent 26S proteasome regulatory subunit
MPTLPSYYPQLASHYDDNEDSELSRLRPNFTQTLQSTIIAKYPHYGQHHNHHSTTKKTTTKKPSSTTTTAGNNKQRPQAQTPTEKLRKKHQQMVQESKSKVSGNNKPSMIDRFSADILDPNPKLNNKVSTNKTAFNNSNVKLPNNFNQGSVVSIDEWKSILIEKLTNAISKVAASQELEQTTSSHLKLPG